MLRQEKIDIVAQYGQLFKEANAFFVADYKGLTVADMTVLRKNLREKGARLVVGKNTLFRLAAKEAEISGIEQHLQGPTAIAFSSGDPAVAAKILHTSYKDKELPRMKAFWVDRVAYDGGQIERLAELPSREVLLAQLLSVVGAPLTKLAGVLDAFFQQLLGGLKAVEDKKRAEG